MYRIWIHIIAKSPYFQTSYQESMHYCASVFVKIEKNQISAVLRNLLLNYEL